MTVDRLRTIAEDFVAQATNTPEHEIEHEATDRALRRFSVRTGEGDLTPVECQTVRDIIMTLVG